MVNQIIRFADLKKAGVVNNRATLSRWIKQSGFPCGFLIGPNSRRWYEHEVDEWLCLKAETTEAITKLPS